MSSLRVVRELKASRSKYPGGGKDAGDGIVATSGQCYGDAVAYRSPPQIIAKSPPPDSRRPTKTFLRGRDPRKSLGSISNSSTDASSNSSATSDVQDVKERSDPVGIQQPRPKPKPGQFTSLVKDIYWDDDGAFWFIFQEGTTTKPEDDIVFLAAEYGSVKEAWHGACKYLAELNPLFG